MLKMTGLGVAVAALGLLAACADREIPTAGNSGGMMMNDSQMMNEGQMMNDPTMNEGEDMGSGQSTEEMSNGQMMDDGTMMDQNMSGVADQQGPDDMTTQQQQDMAAPADGTTM